FTDEQNAGHLQRARSALDHRIDQVRNAAKKARSLPNADACVATDERRQALTQHHIGRVPFDTRRQPRIVTGFGEDLSLDKWVNPGDGSPMQLDCRAYFQKVKQTVAYSSRNPVFTEVHRGTEHTDGKHIGGRRVEQSRGTRYA